jgi:hypothetical protein
MASTEGLAAVGDTGRGQAHFYTAEGGNFALGKVTAFQDGVAVFAPAGTNYVFQLDAPDYAGPIGKPVKGIIRVKARKVWTVPSGGNFIAPIFGPPKTIQGRVRSGTAKEIVVHAGCQIHVELPDQDIVYDLANGPIKVGSLVNVTAYAGGMFELAK